MRNTQISSKCHSTRMFQLEGSTSLTQFVPNVTMKIFYYEQTASNITLDSSTMSKFLWYTSRELYFEQNSSAKPADSSTSKIPLINQQTALLWAKFLWYTSRQFYYEQNSSDKPADSSTMSKIPLIYQQTALLEAEGLIFQQAVLL